MTRRYDPATMRDVFDVNKFPTVIIVAESLLERTEPGDPLYFCPPEIWIKTDNGRACYEVVDYAARDRLYLALAQTRHWSHSIGGGIVTLTTAAGVFLVFAGMTLMAFARRDTDGPEAGALGMILGMLIALLGMAVPS